MPRDYTLYLEDILEAIRKVEFYVKGITLEELAGDSMRRDAVLYNLLIIGEAVKAIPDSMKAQYPSIEWRKIGGLRDFVAHEYFGVNLQIIWDVAQNKLTSLRRSIEEILGAEH
jgi:uncharacterized protein with HEPN domain